MVNFLQISEPEAAALDMQNTVTGDALQARRQARNALVSQYGPEAADPEMQAAAVNANTEQQVAPYKVQSAQLETQGQQLGLDAAHLQLRQRAALAAAQAMKQATDRGIEVGTAYDTIIKPNADILGLNDADSTALRQHLIDQPGSIDALITGLQGPAKPEGGPQYYRLPDGSMGEGVLDERGQFHVVPLPDGAQPLGPLGFAGAPQVVQNPDGSWSMAGMTKAGNIITAPINGTPTKGMNAVTGAYSAGVRGNNSEYGALPGTAPPTFGGAGGTVGGVPTSAAGAVGPGQVTPKFFQTFARPGEKITNPADNVAVANRGIDYYMQQYKDPARAAVAYYSGPDNVAPPGSKTPWRTDRGPKPGVPGPPTSGYVQQVMARVRSGQSINQAILSQESGGAASGGQGGQGGPAPFASLPPKGRQQALDAARTVVNSSQQLASIDDQIGNINKLISPLSIGVGSLTSGIPGTPANNLHAALSTLRSQGLTSWLQSLKSASGNTGIGRVLQSEATAAMNSFGALEQSQSESQFRYHLGIFQQRVHQLQSNAEQAFKQQYGTDVYSALGVQAPAAGGNAHMSDSDLLAKYGVH